MSADAGASPGAMSHDFLDEAEKAIARGATPDIPMMLALIDIAESLRDIRRELHDIQRYGIKRGL